MTSGASSLDSSGSGPPSLSYPNNERGLSSTSRDHGGLKEQYEKAIKEVQVLRRQNSDMSRRCDHTSKELDYYRNQNRAVKNQLETTVQESSALRAKCGELVVENQRLEREIQNLQDMSTLQSQDQQEIMGHESNNCDSMNQLYLTLSRKYESIKDEYDSLRKRHDDFLASHSAAVNKLELAQEELARTKSEYEEIVKERNAAIKERNGLKQQCATAIMQWDIILRERDDCREALAKMQQQHDEAVKEINQAMNVRMKASKDLKRLTEERNAAMMEYTLIMSERDSVHKEMEKLTDDLSQEIKKNKTLLAQNKEYAEEKKVLSYQIETLKREIQSALHDRDKVLKECNDLREKFGEFTAKEESNQAYKSRTEFNLYCRERNNSRQDQAEVSSSTRDIYGKSQKERMENLDQANQELDILRKQIDKLQAELQEATQEAEVSKRRRDWAFSERDKIVMERESMRTLCDRLRKERDRAVSDLAEALRDSDDIKKQRNEASKELKELKEKMEAQLEKENRMQQFQSIGHNHSHDSAIDTDMQEWETEILDIDLTGITSDDDLGFDLVGGRDDPQYPNDAGIYVSSITEGSITDGKLKVNDCISRVNNLDCSNVSKRKVLETVRSSGGTASMVIRRRRVGARCLYTTQLQVHLNFEHGLTLETGIYISKINPESLAAKEGNLAVGDRILSINNKPMDGLKSAREAMAILDEAGDVITITAFKNMSGQNGSTEDDRGFGMRNQNVSPKEHGVEHRHCKTVNSSSQTDDRSFALSPSEEYMDRRYYEPKSKSREKSSGNSGTWKKIRDQFHSVTGPKSSARDDKKHVRNMSPTGEAFDAIAELDSVIDTYHPKQTKRKEKGVEQNGGTWPKVRVGPIIQQGTGTIVHPRKTKVRSPLSDILPNNSINKYQTDFPKRSNPRPVSDFVPFAKSGQIMHSLSPRSFKEPSMEFERNPDRHTLSVLAPSDGSIDLSVKSGNGGKDIMDYYKWKNNRYPVSDSESNMSPLEGSLPPHVRGHSQLYPSSGLRSLPHYPFPHHPHPHISSRYPSPTHIPYTHSGDSIGGYSGGFEPSRTPPQQPFHTHSPSVDYPKSLSLPSGHNHQQYRVDDNMPPVVSPLMPGHEVGTYPRKKENQRIRIPNLVMRIPSNPNVINSNKVSTGSIERTSERGSPMPPYYTFEVINPGRDNKRNSLPDYYCSPNKVALGEIRKVEIDKSIIRYQSELLGIQIRCPKEGGGIFISSVTENSIASKVGLLIGHQLLDVCGVNLRNATYELAAKVLQQCGNNDDSITMLVQYNPDKYHEVEASPSTSDDESHSRSDSPTPCNSPKTNRKSAAESSNLRGTYARSTLTRNQISPVVSTLTKQNAAARSSGENTKSIHEARYVCIETKKCSNLGISLVGGNAVGIFVHSVQVDSSAYNAGLRTGDQILECRGVDLRHATAEEAAYELAKPADKVTILALCNIDRYNEVKDKPGDSFYIRALFDRLEINDSSQLKFHKDDILYVDNTMYDQVPGYWSAWLVDEDGNKKKNGIIPSKYKVEEDMLRRSMGDLESDSRRGTTTARRSFFRRKKHQRSSSRDSKELASFISTMNWYSDSGALNEETALSSYQRVERLDYPTYRPVIIIGPFSDCVIDKLIQEYPNKFSRHVPQTMTCSQSTIDKGVAEKKIIDYRKKGNYFEYTTVAAVKDLCDKNSHCILDVNLSAVERLHKHQIYPVVLLMKFKSTKQIKEVKDIRFATDKVSAKAAKEMYEHALKLESEYKNCISVVIQITGVNIAYMCTQIKTVVDEEQNKTLWVPFTNS